MRKEKIGKMSGFEDELLDMESDMTYVKISEDGMKAVIYVTPADGELYDRSDLKDILRANGVNTGYHESNLAAILKKKIFHREVLAAVGTQPGEGRDGYYEYKVNIEKVDRSPKIREDGSVDYASMNLLDNVQAGDLLAIYHPAEPGDPGNDVRGKIIEPVAVKNLLDLKGNGISKKSPNNEFFATMDGKISMKNGQLEIHGVHEISEDVDYLTGVVDFNGDVVIKGNVGSDVVIRATKSVVISGTVEAATIEAGGDVILKRGINGNEKAQITCEGNVFADFIELANVKAKGCVKANSIVNSTIESEDKVILTGAKGTLLGGETYAMHGVEAVNFGNDVEIKTIIQVGFKKESYNRRTHVAKQMSDVDEQLKDVGHEIVQAEKMLAVSGESPMQEMKRRQLIEKKDELRTKYNEFKAEYEELNAVMESCRDAAVRANGNIYRGCTLFINNGVLPIENNTCYMNYVCKSGLIEGSVIVRN